MPPEGGGGGGGIAPPGGGGGGGMAGRAGVSGMFCNSSLSMATESVFTFALRWAAAAARRSMASSELRSRMALSSRMPSTTSRTVSMPKLTPSVALLLIRTSGGAAQAGHVIRSAATPSRNRFLWVNTFVANPPYGSITNLAGRKPSLVCAGT